MPDKRTKWEAIESLGTTAIIAAMILIPVLLGKC